MPIVSVTTKEIEEEQEKQRRWLGMTPEQYRAWDPNVPLPDYSELRVENERLKAEKRKLYSKLNRIKELIDVYFTY